jgi:hypothetical protein
MDATSMAMKMLVMVRMFDSPVAGIN